MTEFQAGVITGIVIGFVAMVVAGEAFRRLERWAKESGLKE